MSMISLSSVYSMHSFLPKYRDSIMICIAVNLHIAKELVRAAQARTRQMLKLVCRAVSCVNCQD